jgi:hypothetical protein
MKISKIGFHKETHRRHPMKITLRELEDFGKTTNLVKHIQKFKPEHWDYAARILAGMDKCTEEEMNKSWAKIPRYLKPSLDDKLARVVPELICRFISFRHSRAV